jgi:hypothetical protein
MEKELKVGGLRGLQLAVLLGSLAVFPSCGSSNEEETDSGTDSATADTTSSADTYHSPDTSVEDTSTQDTSKEDTSTEDSPTSNAVDSAAE